jgi:ABC-type uncharacterized transport system permease subunit
VALESPTEKIIYGLVVPILAAVIGALVATWFGAASVDHAQVQDVVGLLKDPNLSGPQKLKALEIYKEITDRPWGLARTLVTTATIIAAAIGFAWAFRIQNKR